MQMSIYSLMDNVVQRRTTCNIQKIENVNILMWSMKEYNYKASSFQLV